MVKMNGEMGCVCVYVGGSYRYVNTHSEEVQMYKACCNVVGFFLYVIIWLLVNDSG